MRLSGLAVGLAFAVGLLLGHVGSDGWAAEILRVSQKGRNFALSDIQIARGDTLVFTNEDDFLHQIYVKSPDLNFDSDEQLPGQTIEVRFRSPGRYDVRCRIHPKMLLVVTVK